jgi:AraC-like DNA-binding protein
MNTEDALADVLRGLTLPGWNAGIAACRGAWATDLSAGMVCCYVLRSGVCDLVAPESQATLRLNPLEACLVPATVKHQLRRPGPREAHYRDISQAPFEPDGRDASAVTELLYGRFPNQFTRGIRGLLPAEVVKLAPESHADLGGLPALVEFIFDEAERRTPGSQAVIERAAEALFVQLVRAYALEACSSRQDALAGHGCSLQAMLAPAIGPALGVIHSRPGAPWTVKGLARRAGMAKSSFSERFRDAVGRPPLQYLTDVRMQKACELLARSDMAVKSVAVTVGYESASSFSSAFKRRIGCGPAEYRKQAQSAAKTHKSQHAVGPRISRRAVPLPVRYAPAHAARALV